MLLNSNRSLVASAETLNRNDVCIIKTGSVEQFSTDLIGVKLKQSHLGPRRYLRAYHV